MTVHEQHLPDDLAVDDDRRLTRRQTAVFLGVSTTTLERWARLGILRPVETGANMSWYLLGDVRAFARGRHAAA
jgi:predicted site-specific integrase-resolvase